MNMMNKMNFAMFMAGAAVGSAAAWMYLKKHYERIAQEEIDSVKATFAERKVTFNDEARAARPDTQADIAKLKPDLIKYAGIVKENNYTNYSEHSKANNEEGDDSMSDKPYVISPEEYEESDDYTLISLTCYSDGILVDDEDEIMKDTEETVGEDFVNHFGDYENDTVFVRNDRLRCDYEILKDHRSFKDVTGFEPDQED